MTITGAPARPLRADAARNRARILSAAGEVFAERGIDVTLDDIAAHAGLGVGTVYRRFADREALVEALFDQRARLMLGLMQSALQAPDGWEALVEVIRTTCTALATDRGFRQVMLSSKYGHDEVARCRAEFPPLVEQLVERAKATGKLRSDFEATDVPMIFLMVGTVADFAGEVQPGLWGRYLDLLLDGMRAQEGAGTAVQALRVEEMFLAMESWCPTSRR
jgi:AcrR family transcriptional regulator